MPVPMGHEKLRVYQLALSYAAWTYSMLRETDQQAIVLDHWDRATESIIENLANGNSRRSQADRNRYFNVALGSTLECAACLDICCRRKMLTTKKQEEGKQQLVAIAKMLVGLRENRRSKVKEQQESYSTAVARAAFFPHETLDVYRIGLDLVTWLDVFLAARNINSSDALRLEKEITGVVLNIAEGNGRFSDVDQKRFLDIAHTCAMQAAAHLDILVAKREAGVGQVEEGKLIVTRVVSLLQGLRNYLDRSEDE